MRRRRRSSRTSTAGSTPASPRRSWVVTGQRSWRSPHWGVPGETVTSAELTIEFVAESQQLAWEVGLGVPSATQADVFEFGALIRIDAVTGEATIVKS